jgi:hypothetical protein
VTPDHGNPQRRLQAEQIPLPNSSTPYRDPSYHSNRRTALC